MKQYTAIVAQNNGYGTHWVDSFESDLYDIPDLRSQALKLAATDWDRDPEGLHVIALFEGDCNALYYDDSIYGHG